MPSIPSPAPTAPFDTVEGALNLARVRMNDAIQSAGGDILTDAQPFTQTMANAAWRGLQDFLANMGYTAFKKPLVLTAFPIAASSDPASQTQLNWSYFFDGVSYYSPATTPTAPVLPQDLIIPLRMWERLTGTNSSFIPMEPCADALPDVRKGGLNRFWLWENNTIYMPGSLFSMDLRLEYSAYLPDFVTNGAIQWYTLPIPIMRAMDALADFICAEAAGPRGDVDAATFIASGEKKARLIFNQEVSQKQRRPVNRRPYTGRGGMYGSYS